MSTCNKKKIEEAAGKGADVSDRESLFNSALAYAEEGLAIIPLHNPLPNGSCSCGAPECGKSTGKHPRPYNGLKAATTNVDQIGEWWTKWRDANIGLPTGAVNGLVIIDVDGADGEESLRRMTEKHGPLPATRKVKTGNGYQLYFKHPGGKVKSKAPFCADYPHVDSRGDGGYVVAAPSLHYSGVRYTVDETMPLALADLPSWLLDLINGDRKTRAVQSVDAANDSIPEGSRNAKLASLAGTMRRRGASREAIEAALLTTNAQQCDPPLPEDEVRAIARSISSYAPDASDDVYRSLTDAGNAKRFARRYFEALRYVAEWGQWIVWQGTHWEVDATGTAMELAKALAASIYDEGNVVEDAKLRVAIAKHAKRTASAARLKAMLDLATSEPELVLNAADLDSHRGLLGVENGTLNLASGKLRPASRDDYITMLAPVAYDPAAECPEFLKFLDKIMGGSDDLVDFLQRVVGYALSGYTPEQCLFFFFGTGANGKSTLLTVLRDLLGHRYYMVMPSDALMVRPGKSGATPELARLPGARVVVTNEVEDGTHLAESLVKLMTGGDRIAARHLYQSFFEFVPQFKLFIVGNHKPVVRGDDYGIWRRIHLVPFLVTIPAEERDPDLTEKLRKELPGILNWAVAGYQAWRARGLAPPPDVTDAVDAYKKEMDIFGQWVEECCELGDGLEIAATSAYTSFKGWSNFNGFRGWTNATFGRKVRERFEAKRTAAGVTYAGFRVKKGAEFFLLP